MFHARTWQCYRGHQKYGVFIHHSPSEVGLVCWVEDEGGGEGRRLLHSLHYGDEVSARWLVAQQNVLEEEDGIHTADLVAPMTCGEVEGEDDDEVVSAAPFVDLVTLAVQAQASHFLA